MKDDSPNAKGADFSSKLFHTYLRVQLFQKLAASEISCTDTLIAARSNLDLVSCRSLLWICSTHREVIHNSFLEHLGVVTTTLVHASASNDNVEGGNFLAN